MYIIIPSKNKGNIFQRRNFPLRSVQTDISNLLRIIRWNENSSSKKPKVLLPKSIEKKSSPPVPCYTERSNRKRFIKDLCLTIIIVIWGYGECFSISLQLPLSYVLGVTKSFSSSDTLFSTLSVTVYNNYTPISDIFHQVLFWERLYRHIYISECIDVKNYPYSVPSTYIYM